MVKVPLYQCSKPCCVLSFLMQEFFSCIGPLNFLLFKTVIAQKERYIYMFIASNDCIANLSPEANYLYSYSSNSVEKIQAIMDE